LLCVLFLPAIAGAQVLHRCERDGRISFSDVPCAAGAKATRKTYTGAAASGDLDLQVALKTYDVEGRDYDSLTASLRDRGPRGFHGLASWSVGYETTMAHDGNQCRLTSVRVKISGEILMPQWVDVTAAPLQLQRQWEDYYAALKRHEDGHIQHGRELALLIKERLLSLGTVPCDRIHALAKGEYDRLYTGLKDRDKEYDARTNHGETQGAYFRRPAQF
jgi:predicted secreted Zn-dependent protease